MISKTFRLPAGSTQFEVDLINRLDAIFKQFADELPALGWLDVNDYAKQGDSDNSASFLRARDALGTSPGVVYVPAGSYNISETIQISNHRQGFIGTGKQSSIINFNPSGADTAFYFYKSGAALVQCFLKGFGFGSTSTYDYAKVAVETRNVEELHIEEVAIYPWNGDSASVGFKSGGKHTVTWINCDIMADLPIHILDNPDSVVDCDHYNFHNLYLIADVGECIRIDSGVMLYNFNFTGYQAWIPKTHGLYWSDTETSGIASNLYFHNVRIEQETDDTAFLFYIKHNTGIYNLKFDGVYGGTTAKGYYLRKCYTPTFDNCVYVNGNNNVALDVDNTVLPINIRNCFWQAGTTADMSGHVLVIGSGKYPTTAPLPHSGVYVTSATFTAPTIGGLATYADNAAALAGGLVAGNLYRVATGGVMVVYTP